MEILIGCLVGGVIVLLLWSGHLIHRQRDLRRLLCILTERTLSEIAKELIELDRHSHRPAAIHEEDSGGALSTPRFKRSATPSIWTG
jgi:hypothetical protein